MLCVARGPKGELHLRASEVVGLTWEHGDIQDCLVITTRTGERYFVRDFEGSAHRVEARLLAAIAAALQQDRV